MNNIQLDFWETKEESELRTMRECINKISVSTDKVRKGTYSKIGAIHKIVLDLESRLSLIEHNICKGK